MTNYQKQIDLTGKSFGKLIVEFRVEKRSSSGCIQYSCLCECGNRTITESNRLRKGRVLSCGCLQLESAIKHGMWNKPVYKTWVSLIQRCLNPNSTSYPKYGGRGIKVCDRWKESFQNFYDDMGDRPSINHSIDRKDVNGNYEFSNCRWATSKEQGRNRTNNNFLEYKGEIKCMTEWCEIYNIPISTFNNRLIKGMSVKDAIETPRRKKAIKKIK